MTGDELQFGEGYFYLPQYVLHLKDLSRPICKE